jgi:hypothetical protein
MFHHIFLQELDEEGEGHEVDFGQCFDVLFYMFLFIGDALVVEKCLVGGVGDDGFFEVGEEAFDQTGDQEGIFYFL